MKKKKLTSWLLCGLISVSAVCLFVGMRASADSIETDFYLDYSISDSYTRGEYLEIPKARYTVDGVSYEAKTTLTYPSENYSSASSVALYEIGEYTLQYCVQSGDKTYVDTYAFSVVNQASSLFSYGANVKAQNDAQLFDYFGENDGEAHSAQLQENKRYSTIDAGVRFTVSDDGTPTQIRYNQIVNLADIGFDNADTQTGGQFVEFFFTPDMNSELELEKFKIVLTDVYDENNYLTINFAHLAVQPSLMRAKVAPCDMYEPTSYYWGTAGTYVNSSMYGRYQDYNTNSVMLYYDVADNEIWSKPSNGTSIFPLMNGFNNPGIVGYGNEWQGFTTGEVYVSFIVEDTLNGKASFTLLSVGGKSLTGDYTKTGTVDLKIFTGDYEPTRDILKAGEHHSFAIFDSIAQVENYGFVDVYTEAYYNDTQRVTIENGKLPLRKAGKYTLVYLVDSVFGYARKTVDFTVRESYENELGYTVNENTVESAFVGDRVYFYEGEAFGGYGEKSVSVLVKFDGNTVAVDYDSLYPSFVASREGVYEIVYTVTDSIGYSIEKTATVECVKNPILTLEKPMISGVYLIGRSYTFAPPKSNESEAMNSVFIDGQEYTNLPYTVTKDFTLTYQVQHGDSVYAEDVACKAIPEKDGVDYITSFFYSDSVGIESTENGVFMRATQADSEVRFMQEISTDLLNLTFINQADLANYGGLSFTISDTKNPSETVEISFKKQTVAGVSFFAVAVNGTVRAKADLWLETDGNFGFALDKTDNGIYDLNGKKLVELEHYANGSAFKGFSSGYVYMRMRFLGVEEESGLTLRVLAGQVYSNLIVADVSGPVILVKGELSTFMTVEEGSEVLIPSAYAYDAFHGATEVTVRIVGPSGEIYKGGISNGYTLTVGEANSSYTVTYETFDTSAIKNRSRKVIYINVVRTDTPQITVLNAVQTAKVGVEYTVAQISVECNNSVKTTVYITDFNDRKIYIEDGKYTFTKAGRYRVYYYVEDEYKNVAITSYSVEVSD